MIHVLSNILTTAETTVLGLLDLSVASDCADLNYKTKRGVCPSVRPPVLTVAPTPSGIRTHRHSSFLAYVVCHWQKSAGGIYCIYSFIVFCSHWCARASRLPLACRVRVPQGFVLSQRCSRMYMPTQLNPVKLLLISENVKQRTMIDK